MKKLGKTVEIITNETAGNWLLNYLNHVLKILPQTLRTVITEYCKITPQFLLDWENDLYLEMKTPFSCRLAPHVEEDFRNNLRKSIEAIPNGKPVMIRARTIDIKQSNCRSFEDPTAALEFLIKTGTKVLGGTPACTFPHRLGNFSLEDLLLDYQHAYQCRNFSACKSREEVLKAPALTGFLENILQFSNRHFPISFTSTQFKHLKNLTSAVLMRGNFFNTINSIILEAFLINALNLEYWTYLSVFVLENINDQQDCVVYVDKQYPQAIQYLTQLKLKISQLKHIDENCLKHTKLPHDCSVDVDPLIDTIEELSDSLHGKWSLKKAPMSSYLILLWAIKYEVLIPLIPCCKKTNNFKSKDFKDDPMVALTQLLMQPKGLLDHFKESRNELKPDVHSKMDKLIKDTLNLTKTHASSFFSNSDKHPGVSHLVQSCLVL